MSKEMKLLERSDIESKYKWDVESFYKDLNEWEKDAKKLKVKTDELLEYKGRLGNSEEMLYEGLSKRTEVFRLATNLYSYSSLRLDEDTRKSEFQALSDRAFRLYLEASEKASFFTPELLEIGEDKIRGFLANKKELEIYKHYFQELFRRKDHVLSAREESIMAQIGEVSSAPENIFSMLNNADLKFPVIKDENNNDLEISHGNYIPLMESRDRRVRKDAFKALYSTYKGLENTFAAILDGELKSNRFSANMRKYENTMVASLDGNNISTNVYDNLINAIHENLEPMYDYMKIRKRVLGLDENHMYDIYVPIVEEVDYKFTFEEGKEIIRKALAPLGQEYIEIVDEGFNSGWIDVYENVGKRSGGYSGGSYDSKPYILLNYKDTMDSVFTMAHEMGHSIHSYLSRKNQPFIYASYSIFVAEVASTVNEVLLLNYLLKNADTKEDRKYLLNHQLDSFRATVYRQTMFAEFEKNINKHIEDGNALTAEYLNKTYKKLNELYYGPDVIIDEEIASEWSRIPHFYYNYYVYQYATGYSAAVTIAEKILNGEEGIVEKYLEFLSAGGSDYPLNTLKKLGIDMETKEPITKALDTFRRTVEEMKELTK